MDVAERAKRIKLLLMDCDGVLTDGRLYFGESGEAMKVFHVRDGQGLAMWHAAGNYSGIISGRDAEKIVRKRTDELGIHHLKLSSADKVKDCEGILAATGLTAEETCFIGDDIGDIELMKHVGLSAAVADAVAETRSAAHFITENRGGQGAVRELIDLLLRSR